jgi:hypothetical protein
MIIHVIVVIFMCMLLGINILVYKWNIFFLKIGFYGQLNMFFGQDYFLHMWLALRVKMFELSDG